MAWTSLLELGWSEGRTSKDLHPSLSSRELAKSPERIKEAQAPHVGSNPGEVYQRNQSLWP